MDAREILRTVVVTTVGTLAAYFTERAWKKRKAARLAAKADAVAEPVAPTLDVTAEAEDPPVSRDPR